MEYKRVLNETFKEMVGKRDRGLKQPESYAKRDLMAERIKLWPVIMILVYLPHRRILFLYVLEPVANDLICFFAKSFCLSAPTWSFK
jgi:hypothetical protein